MGTFLITGAGGYLAGRLTEFLLGWDGCDGMVGLDVKPAAIEHPKLAWHISDIRYPETTTIIAREKPDVLVHTAFAVDFLRRTKEEQSVNLGGLERVMAGAEKAGCGQLIVISSTVVYGAYPGIATFQDEDDPVCIHPDLPYARDKVLAEKMCRDFTRRNPDTKVCIVRPAIVVGPSWGNFWAAAFFMLPFVPRIDGHDTLFQFIHEDDLVQLLRLCIEKEAAGTFNAAADGAITLREIGKILGKPTFPVHSSVAKAWMWIQHHTRLLPIGSPPAAVDFFSYPWVASNARAREVLGFSPVYSSREAFAEAVRLRADILRNMGKKAEGGYRLFNAMLKQELRKSQRCGSE